MSMSLHSKRKQVMKEAQWEDHQLPGRNQYIVKVLRSTGNNLHMVSSCLNYNVVVTNQPSHLFLIVVCKINLNFCANYLNFPKIKYLFFLRYKNHAEKFTMYQCQRNSEEIFGSNEETTYWWNPSQKAKK